MSYIADLAKVEGAVLKPPPVNSYFHVSFFPGYMNLVKIVKLSSTAVSHARLEEKYIFRSLAVFNIVKGVQKEVPWHQFGINPLDFRFNSVSGLSSVIETEDVREGGFNNEMLQLPNRVIHENLVLERGFMDGSDSITSKEFNVAMNLFTMIPGEIMVTLMDPDQRPLAAWLFRNAFPAGLSNTEFRSDDSDIFMEKMEFCYSHRHQLVIDSYI